MVQVTPGGTVYAFIAGSGLLQAEEPGFQWAPVSNDFGGDLVLHLAAGKGEETQRRLYVVTFDPETRSQALYASRHGGRSRTRPGPAWKLASGRRRGGQGGYSTGKDRVAVGQK